MQGNHNDDTVRAPYEALSIDEVENEYQQETLRSQLFFPEFLSRILVGKKNIIRIALVYSLYTLLLLLFIFYGGDMKTTPRLKPKRPPHIVFVLSDDMGWNDYGIHGSKQCETPHIDGLSRNGIILNNYYVTAACSPSRASLLSGRNTAHTGIFK